MLTRVEFGYVVGSKPEEVCDVLVGVVPAARSVKEVDVGTFRRVGEVRAPFFRPGSGEGWAVGFRVYPKFESGSGFGLPAAAVPFLAFSGRRT